MSEIEAKKSAAPAGTASAAVTSPESGDVPKIVVRTGNSAVATPTVSQSIPATPDQPNKPSQAGLNIEGLTSIRLGDAELLYVERWLPDSEQWFERLKSEVPWSPERVKMYGKPLVLKRETCNFGEDYDYNVNAKPAIEWDGPVLELKKMLEDATGRVFTQCACNLYPDGETGIGLHHDKRHPLLVASISFGAVRTMGFAPKGGKLDKFLPMVPLASGSLLLFSDEVNENFKHAIAEDKSVRGPRISVTFREFEPASASEGGKRKPSVATQQKLNRDGLNPAPAGMFTSVDYTRYTDEELHEATVAAIAAYKQKREEADNYAYDVLVPALNQIIQRYKQQGRATSYRLNGCPTVEEYFKSIGLNYSTVRSWKSRAQQRLLQAATDAGTKPAPVTSDRDGVPHLNKAATKALIEGNHRAVEMVDALEAGRDAKHEITGFKAVMNAKRLDDIMQAHEQEPDYKGILMKVVQIVADMNATLPAAFVKSVRDLTKPCKFKIAIATVSSRKSNGNGTPQPLQIAPIPQKRPEWLPLEPGKKYTVRPHPQGGSGVYEVGGSTVCWQKHPSQDEAWDAIEAVNVPPASAARSEMSGNADEGVSIAADSLFPASNKVREVNAPPTPGG